jgi:hypothetical protein
MCLLCLWSISQMTLQHHAGIGTSSSGLCRQNFWKWLVLPQHQHISLFFRMRGDRLLHGALSLIFWSPMEDLTVSFMILTLGSAWGPCWVSYCLRRVALVLCSVSYAIANASLVPYERDLRVVQEKAQWVNYSMVVANYYGDSPLSWVGVFSWLC